MRIGVQEVFIEVSLSIDGVIAGPEISPAYPMANEGRRLHHWNLEPSGPKDRAAGARMFEDA